MKKGISAIIATIILLMITVALVGLLWSFSSGLFGSISASAGSQANAAITRAGTEFTIINARNTTLTAINVTVRNSGTQNIDLDTLAAFVDNSAASDTASGRLAPGSTSNFNVTSSFRLSQCGNHTLRLSVSYASDAYYTVQC